MDIVSLRQLPDEMPVGQTGVLVGAAILAIDAAATALGFNVLYKVDIVQSTEENRIMNTLYYRCSDIVPFAGNFAGAADVAYQVEQEVIPKLRACISQKQLIEKVVVTPFTPLFERVLMTPYEEHVGLYGSRYGIDLTKTQRYAARLRFNLSPNGWVGQIQNLLGLLPKTGRVYIGALGSGDLGSGETINGSGLFGNLEDLAEKLADPLFNVAPPVNFVPIRVKRLGFAVPEAFQPIVGKKFVNVYTTWADVDSCAVSTEVTFLRSREL